MATQQDVDGLIDQMRTESPELAPILMQVVISGDPYTQGLDVGLKSDRGVLRYSGRDWFEGLYSTGELPITGTPLLYFYMDTDTEFPPNAEVSIDAIRQAVKEFLATNGALPTCVRWQADQGTDR
ncbi:Imm1 family immunity protein [Actinokineospora sp.]|uniref:Imm1 family immunity protein n=1 Tax=Actinokineospora sp. TaxID=1872133 RepID=UPI00403812DB